MSHRPSFEQYIASRESILNAENSDNFESDVKLNPKEERANAIIMTAKNAELDDGLANPQNFAPSRYFFEVLDKINKSKLFKIIRKMPKGGILHAHDTALCSTDYLVSLTYRDNLWQCNDNSNAIVGFKFARNTPDPIVGCKWVKVADERARIGRVDYDAHIRSNFTLNTNSSRNFSDINDVWNEFMGLFIRFEPLVTYAPVFKDYYKQALKEMLQDGVQYLELRVLLPPVYDLDGKIYSFVERVQLYVDGLNEFKAENPDFIGSKFIFAPLKAVPEQTILEYIDIMTDLQRKFPEYIAGFDLVGQEDTAPKLFDLAQNLLKIPDDIQFFYHAGETNWFGSIDENLVDAILLGTKRIGHAYALSKHPQLLKLVKERDIAIEVNPVSNQVINTILKRDRSTRGVIRVFTFEKVLKLVDDLRNHPAAVYFSQNVPMIISSDDPSFWGASPLSHDFYMAFLGIASKRSDLRTLKKLATNSIKYSSLNKQEREIAFAKWQTKWDRFIEDVIAEC
ncbi:hypothetical protein HA402_002001 [Bradysia odoriphaga]|nr:hypothetical protein HA402_002001 [Bradysia odoriphaga]